MAAVYTLFGELKGDTSSFTKSLLDAEKRLENTQTALTQTEKRAQDLGKTTATTARGFEKMNERLADTHRKLSDAVQSFSRGETNAKQFARAIESAERSFSGLNSRVKDAAARVEDFGNRSRKSMTASVTGANLLADAIGSVSNEAKQFAVDGVKMNASLDKLTRFTATLDKNFQSPVALNKFREDIKQLSTEIPHTAEQIAKASFSIKSAFAELTEPQVIDYLRQFGIAATGSNTDIAQHTENLAALAKQYKITADQLPRFNAMIASSFGQALSKDSEVADGFNKILNAAIAVKQPLETVIGAMSTLQGTSNDAAANTVLLSNVLSKLTDAKYQEGFEAIGIKVFDASGKFRDLTAIIGEMAKKLDGMSDEQIAEKFAFLRDKEAREGFFALARGFQTFENQVKNGGSLEAYKEKTDLMLGSIESRWSKFWSNITNTQSGMGGKITDFFLEAFDSTTVMGTIGIFFNNVGGAVLKGMLSFAQALNSVADTIADSFLGLFFDADTLARVKQQTRLNLDSLSESIDKITSDNNRSILEKQKKSWQEIADATADPEAKARAVKNVDSLNKAIQSSVSSSAVKLYESYKEAGEAAIKGLASSDEKTKAQAKQTIQTLISAINEASKDVRNAGIAGDLSALGSRLAGAVAGGIEKNKAAVDNAMQNLVNTSNAASAAKSSGFKVGADLGGGLIQGMNSKLGEIRALSMLMGKTAEDGLRTQIKSNSPSKVFFAIGKDVVQGFIDGINALKSSAQGAVASMLDLQNLKAKFGKQDKAGVEFLSSLVSELSKINTVTKEQEVLLELTAGKYGKLNSEVRNRIVLAAQEIDKQGKIRESVDDLFSAVSGFTEKKTDFKSMLQLFSDPAYTKLIEERAKVLGLTADKLREIVQLEATKLPALQIPEEVATGRTPGGGEGLNTQIAETFDVEPVLRSWNNFFDVFNHRVEQLKAQMPTIKQSIAENLVSSIYGIGDVFANAVARWDGTAQGFFKSIASGFADMARQIVAELVRIMVMKAVLKLIGSFAGGGGGGGASAGDIGSAGAPAPGFASGGFTGSGSKFDIAGLVHKNEFVMPANVVKHFGLGFMNQIRNMQTPTMTGGATTNNNQRSTVNNFHINASGGSAEQNQRSATQIKRELMKVLYKEDRR